MCTSQKMDVDIPGTELWDRPRRLAPARMGMNAPTQHAHSMCSKKQDLKGEMFFSKSRLPPKRCLPAEQPKASHTTSECECKRAGSLGSFHLLTERGKALKRLAVCLALTSSLRHPSHLRGSVPALPFTCELQRTWVLQPFQRGTET